MNTCRTLNRIAYKSCIYSYFNSKDREDIVKYWLYLLEQERWCEAEGVEKALELIDIHKELGN